MSCQIIKGSQVYFSSQTTVSFTPPTSAARVASVPSRTVVFSGAFFWAGTQESEIFTARAKPV